MCPSRRTDSSSGPKKPHFCCFSWKWRSNCRGRKYTHLHSTNLRPPPPPIKTVYMAQKSEFVCHKIRSLYAIEVGSYTRLSVKVPLFQGIVMPYDPSFMAYCGSICFANMGGGGGQNYFHSRATHPPFPKPKGGRVLGGGGGFEASTKEEGWAIYDSASPKVSHKRVFTLICSQPGRASTGFLLRFFSHFQDSSCGFSALNRVNARLCNTLTLSPKPGVSQSPSQSLRP